MAEVYESKIGISWSALRSWEECHHRVKLQRSSKKNPAMDIRSFFHGTVVDRVMRAWLEDPDTPSGAMPLMVEEIMRIEELRAIETGDGVVRWKNKNDRREMLAFCKELVARLEPILYELVVPYDYEPAKRFKTPIIIPGLYGSPVQIYLVGEMDLLVKPKDTFEVWDLKGTKNDSYWRKTIGQLVFYDIATRSMFGEATSRVGLIQPMCKLRVMEWSITERQREELMSRVISMVHGIFRKDWAYTEKTSICSFCPVNHACERFKPKKQDPSTPIDLFEIARLTEQTRVASEIS